MKFVAIDFETADSGRDSACSVGLVRVEGRRVVERVHRLIRPPRSEFSNTWVHGISWDDVRSEPAFRTVWLELAPVLRGVDCLAAHYAPFDRSVLRACCESARLSPPDLEFLCSCKLARQRWRLRLATLDHVCDHLGIPLDHHHALSDAAACAEIVLRATA